MTRKHLSLFVLGTIQSLFSITQQNQQEDSLSGILRTQKDDTSKVNTLIALSNHFLVAKKFSDATKYAEDALLLAERRNFKTGILNAQESIGNIYNRRGAASYYEGNHPIALEYFLAALTIFEKYNAKKEIANIRRNIGLVYWKQGNYAEALKNHFISLRLFKDLKDKNAVAAAYNDIGNAYENQGNSAEALNNYLTAYNLFDELGDKGAMIDRLFNIAFLYEDEGSYPDALKSYSTALSLSRQIDNKDAIAACYTNIGGNYYQQGKSHTDNGQKKILYNEALNNYLVSLKYYKESQDKEGLAACYNALGEVYLELKNFSKAKQFLNDGLSAFKKVNKLDDSGESYQLPAEYIRENYRLLAQLDSATGNWEAAFNNYKWFLLYKDSLINEESEQKIMKTQMQYDFGKKEDSLKFQQTLTNQKFEKQKLTKNYLIAVLVLFAILSFFVYWNFRNRSQLKLHILRNKIASDLHDDVGSTLSSISIFSQMAQQQSKEVIPLLETISESSRKMLDAMADIVWTIKPENDHFEKIIARMRSFAYELLGAGNIDFEFIADDNVTQMKLPMEVRKNLYLIFKEATNNMVKYAGANKAMFAIKEEKNNLTMLIRDNGRGFDISHATNGNGLKNMKKRADEIRGQLLIESSPGLGTTIQLNIAM